MFEPFQISRRLLLAVSLAAAAVLSGPAPSAAADAPRVVTTIAMIAQPLAVIAGDRAEVSSLMGPGVDPHLYRATRSDIARLSRADLILWNGLDLEAQLEDALHKLEARTSVVAVGEAVSDAALTHDPDGKLDPHLWMDPALWREAVIRSTEALIAIDPEGETEYRQRLEAYLGELRDLDAYAEKAMATIPAAARVLVTAHDAFTYFGRRFRLEVHGIQGISTESEAGLKAIEDLVDLLVEKQVPAVFIETTVTERNVRALVEGAAARGWTVEIGGTLYSDAMGDPGTYEGTYIGMIDANVTRIVRALGGTAPETGMVGKVSP